MSEGTDAGLLPGLDRIERFLLGEITWAELVGMTMQEAYAIAEIGYASYRQGKLEEARTVFEALVLSNPRDAYFHEALAAVYRRLDHGREALEQYAVAIALEPRSMHALVGRGELLVLEGRLEEAVQDLEAAVALAGSGTEPAAERPLALASAARAALGAGRQPAGAGAVPK